ncbi:MAG: YdbH domain-containing protein [Lentisphaeria bacterium]|nr:YdbH domain-containing protein [Lentisphaeria bacterium]
MALCLGLVVALPSVVAGAANNIIRRMLPGGVIECTVSQISLFQANLAIDARQASTEPDRPGQRVVKLPHCRITYRPLAIIRGRIETIEIIGATMTAQYQNGVFSVPLLQLLAEDQPAAAPPEPLTEDQPAAAPPAPQPDATPAKGAFALTDLPDIGSISLQSCTVMLRWENRFYHTPLTLDIAQGDRGWENPSARAAIRLNGQLLLLRDVTYDAGNGQLNGQIRLSDLRLDSLPPPLDVFADVHRLRGRVDAQADFALNLRQTALNSLDSRLSISDFHARFGQETVESPAIKATLAFQGDAGAFTISQIDTTSLGQLNHLEWRFTLENRFSSHGQLTMTFENTAAEPIVLQTAYLRVPTENKSLFNLATKPDTPPLRLKTAWGNGAAGSLDAAFTHTPAAMTVQLSADQVSVDSTAVALEQAAITLDASFKDGGLTAQARGVVPQATTKTAQIKVTDAVVDTAVTWADGDIQASLNARCATLASPSLDLRARDLVLAGQGQGNPNHQAVNLQVQLASLTAPDDLAQASTLRLNLQAEGAARHFTGEITASIAGISAERYDLAAQGVFWRQRLQTGAASQGTLTIAALFRGDENLLACTMNTTLTPAADLRSLDFNLDTAVLFQDFPTAQLQLSSQNRVRGNIFLSRNTFHLPLTQLSDFDLVRLLPQLQGLTLEGGVSLSGDYAFGGGRPPQGSAHFNLQQVNAALPEQDVLIENLNLRLELPVLPEWRTRAGQPLDCRTLKVGNLVIRNLQARARLESAQLLTLERVQANWAAGTVRLGATQINLQQPEPDLLIFCDRIDLAEALQQLGNDQISGRGTLSGTLPVTVSKGNITFGDGFLATVPGVQGDIRLRAANALTAGVPPGTPAFNQLKFSGDALSHFLYDWLKVSLNNQGDDLQLRLEVSGKPAEPLPYSYVKGEFVAIEGKTDFSQIKLDVNLKMPVNSLLGTIDELQHLMQGFRP